MKFYRHKDNCWDFTIAYKPRKNKMYFFYKNGTVQVVKNWSGVHGREYVDSYVANASWIEIEPIKGLVDVQDLQI